MAIKSIVTFIRPSASVPFFASSEHSTIVEGYKTAGKITATVNEIIEDGLSLVQTRTFASVAARGEFFDGANRNAFKEARNAYNTANGIVMYNKTVDE